MSDQRQIQNRMRYVFLLLLASSFFAFRLAAVSQSNRTVTFRAVYSTELSDLPGHVWVDFGAEELGFGLHGLQNETGRRAGVSYEFLVSEAEYQRGLRVAHQYAERNRRYVLGVNDCRFFAAEVARAMNLEVPPIGTNPPAIWLEELRDLNVLSAKGGKPIYDELVRDANTRHKKAIGLLQESFADHPPNPEKAGEVISLNKQVRDRELSDQIVQLEKQERKCRSEKEQLQKEVSSLEIEARRLTNNISSAERESGSVNYKAPSLRTELHQLQTQLSEPPPSGWELCTCENIHRAKYHRAGYDCANWTRAIPCADDYYCQLNQRIAQLQDQLSNLDREISTAEKTRGHIEAERSKRLAQIRTLDCESIANDVASLSAERDAANQRYDSATEKASDISERMRQLSFKIDQLHLLELSIYAGCAQFPDRDRPCEESLEQNKKYVSYLNSLRDVDRVHNAISKAGFPADPVATWRALEKKKGIQKPSSGSR